MRRFILFQYSAHYPIGGICDLSFDTIEEAVAVAKETECDYNYSQIVDADNMAVVWYDEEYWSKRKE